MPIVIERVERAHETLSCYKLKDVLSHFTDKMKKFHLESQENLLFEFNLHMKKITKLEERILKMQVQIGLRKKKLSTRATLNKRVYLIEAMISKVAL